MTVRVICAHDATTLPRRSHDVIPVSVFAPRSRSQTATIGNGVMDSLERLDLPPSPLALDFLVLALGVIAADTLVRRDVYSDNSWSRNFAVTLPVSTPTAWNRIADKMAATVSFLTGDVWTFAFVQGETVVARRPLIRKWVRTDSSDCVSLFSGGLDSAIGVLELLADGRRPLLVSQAYRGDSKVQRTIRSFLPVQLSHFTSNASASLDGNHDTTMRSRSLLFLALGVIASEAVASRCGVPVDLIVPENGLIAINPPLTSRRIGSLSTRTTHPHFLVSLQALLLELGFPVRISNPYSEVTKGEMMARCRNRQVLAALAEKTVSCGKWKRRNVQCGRCVPCIIRRSAFHAAGISDLTRYDKSVQLAMATESQRDDVLAMAIASQSMTDPKVLRRAILASGPLHADGQRRLRLVDTAARGFAEVGAYLASQGVL